MKGPAPNFGEILRDLRTKAGKSLGELARHLELSVVYLSDVERGRRGPLDVPKILEAAKFLNLDDPGPLLKSGAQTRGTFDLDVTDYTDKAFDVLASLARGGKRRDQVVRNF